MKWKNKDKILLLISVLTLIIFSVPSLSRSKPEERTESLFDVLTSDVSWNKSDYINFTGPPQDFGVESLFRIFIDDENPNYNWSKTAAENDWLTGSGTWSDPYVIENLYFNGQGVGSFIKIQWSNKPFIIRNCWFDYSGPNEYDAGVVIHHTINGDVKDNICTFTHRGVIIEHASTNHTVENNIMISDHTTAGYGRGIAMESLCDNNTISNNKIRNFYDAIYIWTSDNVTVKGNYAENNIWGADYHGFPIGFRYVDDSKIVYNVLAGVFAQGSFIINEVSCAGNVVENNTVITGDTWAFGPPELSVTSSLGLPSLKTQQAPENVIKLEDSDNNYIANNIMIRPESSSNGAIYGYDMFLLLGLVSIASLVLVLIIRKKNMK
ncbi:MAG: NosD domain-containing protein [Candidatus Odinarchaeota archaeon]